MSGRRKVNDFIPASTALSTLSCNAPVLLPVCDKFKKAEHPSGEMAEWLKAHAWKACLGETLTWVRIPLSPP
jgi:hypothetical protein